MTRPRDDDAHLRALLKQQLRRISALWPLTPSNEALDEYARMLWGFTDAEITAGFDHVIDTHAEAFAPKPAHFRTAVGQVAKARRNIGPTEAELVAADQSTLPPPAPDLAAIERWAADPKNAAIVEAQIDHITESWDVAARQQHRHIMRSTAMRLCYERAHPRLKVLP